MSFVDPIVLAQRSRARRTALLVGGIALGIYIAFIASGVFGK